MINASNSRLAKLEASFSKMQKSTQREKNKLKQALKKLEANQKKQEKEFYVERVNERKEFVWQLLKQLGYTFDDICIIGGSLALLKEKIDSGNAADEINACVAKYSELINESESDNETENEDSSSVLEEDEQDEMDACIDRIDE